jgi:ubiquinone/menaquinone biosynthesis C-methylase UbiE
MSAGPEPPATWSGIAAWYDELVRAGSGPHELAVATTLRLVPDLRDARVLDLACGQGLAARALAQAGAASVTGVDLAPEMIEAARRYEAAQPLGIRYLVDDAQTLVTLADGSFDVVTCQLCLMDIPDLAAALASAARVLRTAGSLVFVIGHPCFLAPNATTTETPDGRAARLIGDYLTERFWRSANPNGVRRAGNHHRTLSTYLNVLVSCGFTLDLADEPPAHGQLATDQPVYATVPIFFAARATKR